MSTKDIECPVCGEVIEVASSFIEITSSCGYVIRNPKYVKEETEKH